MPLNKRRSDAPCRNEAAGTDGFQQPRVFGMADSRAGNGANTISAQTEPGDDGFPDRSERRFDVRQTAGAMDSGINPAALSADKTAAVFCRQDHGSSFLDLANMDL